MEMLHFWSPTYLCHKGLRSNQSYIGTLILSGTERGMLLHWGKERGNKVLCERVKYVL